MVTKRQFAFDGRWWVFCLVLVMGACFGGGFAQGLPCKRDADCGPRLRCTKPEGEAEGLCGGPGDPALCGNGLRDDGEDCDDGNTAENDGCTPICRAPVCGDGFLAVGEECDDGDPDGGEGCSKDCRLPGNCGNAVVEPDEECDDGNTVDGDICTPSCRLPVCGDGYVGIDEECDDGNDVGTDECTPTCRWPMCPDGFVNGGEECDDGNDVETDECTSSCALSPEVPELALSLSQVKQFRFSWTARGAEYYQLFERADADKEFVLVGDDIVGESFSLTVPLHLRVNASYKLKACNALRCVESAVLDVAGTLAEAIGYVKASNTGEADSFGASVALSEDGNTLAVGATEEASDSTGIDGQDNDEAPYAGAVYVFVRTGDTWSQQAYVKAFNAGEWEFFGGRVALSEDGNTLAVGASGESSNAQGINGLGNGTASFSGAVYVFVRTDETWSQQAYVKPFNTGVDDEFGASLALSGDGNTLAVGTYGEDGATPVINGPENDNAKNAGAVHVFTRAEAVWTQQAYVKATNTQAGNHFGWSVTLSRSGDTLAVGAPAAGDVHVFERAGGVWSEQAAITPPDPDFAGSYGPCVALSGDGNTLAIGTDSAEVVHVYGRGGNVWSLQSTVEAPGSALYNEMSLALSGDGNSLAIGTTHENSGAVGINGDQEDDSALEAGAGYVFVRSGDAWVLRAYVKAPNTNVYTYFGASIVLSGDGGTLAIGSTGENGGATGIGGDQADDSVSGSGAVYLY